MSSDINIPIPTALFVGLVDFLRQEGDVRDPVEVVRIAIEAWMQAVKDKQLSVPDPAAQGYFWKQVFLPNGTELRMSHNHTTYRAKVIGDEFVYDGQAMSPGKMVDRVKSTARNAWLQLWVKRPQDQEWIIANKLRLDSLRPQAVVRRRRP